MQTVELTKSRISWATESTQHSLIQPADNPDLIRRLKAGDDDAVRELYARYGQRLYTYALRLTNDPATAEDVTQNTLITAWRTAHSFRCEGRPIAWLLGIVHHTAMKAIRNTSRHFDQAAEETVADQQPSREVRALGLDSKRWVRKGLQSLYS